MSDKPEINVVDFAPYGQKEGPCYRCDQIGIYMDEPCYLCDGTGKLDYPKTADEHIEQQQAEIERLRAALEQEAQKYRTLRKEVSFIAVSTPEQLAMYARKNAGLPPDRTTIECIQTIARRALETGGE